MKKFILSVLCFTFLFSAAFFVNGCQKKHEHSDVGNKPENNISFRTLSVSCWNGKTKHVICANCGSEIYLNSPITEIRGDSNF